MKDFNGSNIPLGQWESLVNFTVWLIYSIRPDAEVTFTNFQKSPNH